MQKDICPYCMSPMEPGKPCPNCGLTQGSYQPDPHQLPPGTLLMERYLLGRALGEGGFGITYIGRDTRLDLKVAVKEYYPSTQVSRDCSVSHTVQSFGGTAGRSYTQGRERFIQEARAMARMDKTPEIVGVRDFFEANNTAYIVMEYVDGTTFKDLVAQYGGAIPAEQLLPMIRPLFGALEAMHKQGLIHRDISPDNLMLEGGKVRLLDFGCARESVGNFQSQTMTVILKQGFSPIEQYQHKGQGPWTDVYSLAATIYYCLTGKVPPQPLDRLTDEELIPPRQLGASLTERQEEALLKGMGLQPARRYRSIQEFYAALYGEDGSSTSAETEEDQKTDKDPKADPEPKTEKEENGETDKPEEKPEPGDTGLGKEETPPPGRKSKKGIFFGIGAAAILLIGIGIFALGGESGDSPSTATRGPGSWSTNSYVPASPAETVEDAASFLNAMNSSGVTSISIASGSDVLISSTLDITKPVLVKDGSSLSCSADVTILANVTAGGGSDLVFSGDVDIQAGLVIEPDATVHLTGEEVSVPQGGSITVHEKGLLDAIHCRNLHLSGGKLNIAGHLDSESLIRTSSGGTISVEDTGSANCSVLWLQNWDCITGKEQLNLSDEDVLVLDDDVFQDAVKVHSTKELRDALDNPEVSAIQVEGSLRLSESFTLSKPLWVPMGAFLSGEEGSDVHLTLSEVLLNEGTIDSIALDVTGGGCITTGTASLTLTSSPAGSLVNSGNLTLTGAYWRNSKLLNLGKVTVAAPGEEPVRAEFLNSFLWNLSDSTLQLGDNTTTAFSQGLGFLSRGTLIVDSGAVLTNRILLDGKMIVAGTLENAGGVLVPESIDLYPDAVLNGGLVVLPPEVQSQTGYENTTVLRNAPDTEGVEVDNAWDLLNLCGEGKYGVRLSSGTLDIDGSVTVPVALTVADGASLTIHGTLTVQNGASLTVGGNLVADGLELEDAMLNIEPTAADSGGIHIAGGGPVILTRTRAMLNGLLTADGDGSQLRLSENAVVYNESDITGFSSITLDNVSHLTCVFPQTFQDGTEITLYSSEMNMLSGYTLHQGSLGIDGGSTVWSAGEDGLEGTSVTNDGSLIVSNMTFVGDNFTRIKNNGEMRIGSNQAGQTFRVTGVLENRGMLWIGCPGSVNQIQNFADVVLEDLANVQVLDSIENSGTFVLDRGSYTGELTGNPAEDNRQG